MNTKRDKLGFILALLAFTYVSPVLLMQASCSRSRRAQSEQSAPAGMLNVPAQQNEAAKPDKECQARQGRVFDATDVSQMPECLKASPPKYPEEAKIWGIEAIVILQLVVDENGDVISVKVLHSKARRFRKRFIETAIVAVKQYKFRPAIHDGKPVPCSTKITIRFRLN